MIDLENARIAEQLKSLLEINSNEEFVHCVSEIAGFVYDNSNRIIEALERNLKNGEKQ